MGHRVLIVDDNSVARAIARDLLTADGHRVEEAQDGREALAVLRTSGSDVLVTDLHMPGIGGLELLGEVKREMPWVEAIVVTARDEPELVLESVRAGAVDFVSKVQLASHLLPAVRRALERRRLQGTADLYSACRALLEVSDREDLPRRVVEVATRALDADRCQLWLSDDSGGFYLAHTHQDRDFLEDRDYRKTVERSVQRVAGERTPLFFSDEVRRPRSETPLSDPSISSKVKLLRHVRSSLFFPLLSVDRALGVLVASRVDVQRALANHELHLAGVLASQTVLALELREALRRVLVSERFSVVGRLAAAVAHDVNNPIAYVLANVKYVLDRLQRPGADVDPEMVRALEDAEAGALRVREIARDVKLLAHSSASRRDRFPVIDVVQSAIRMCALDTHSVAVAIDVPAELEVIGNQGQLGQVVMNLVANAVHAIKGTGRRGALGVRAVGDGTTASVFVQDNGTGIPPALAHRVFETFFTTKGTEGTGLGLSLCRDIARAHGGDVILHATDEAGTTFVLRVPQAAAPGTADAQRPLAATTPRVLFVDDEPALLRAYARVFADRFRVVTEEHPLAALELLRRETFDLVVCDVHMPGLTGPELLGVLQSEQSAAAERFILASGSLSPRTAPDLRCPLLAKPFDAAEVERYLPAPLVAS